MQQEQLDFYTGTMSSQKAFEKFLTVGRLASTYFSGKTARVWYDYKDDEKSKEQKRKEKKKIKCAMSNFLLVPLF